MEYTGNPYRHRAGRLKEQPDPSIINWLNRVSWSGERSATELYTDYRESSFGECLSFDRFLLDLDLCGVDQILADRRFTLLRTERARNGSLTRRNADPSTMEGADASPAHIGGGGGI